MVKLNLLDYYGYKFSSLGKGQNKALYYEKELNLDFSYLLVYRQKLARRVMAKKSPHH